MRNNIEAGIVVFSVVVLVLSLTVHRSARRVFIRSIWIYTILAVSFIKLLIDTVHGISDGSFRNAGCTLMWIIAFSVISGLVPGYVLYLSERRRERKQRAEHEDNAA